MVPKTVLNKGTGAEPAMRVRHFVVPLPDTQSGTHVSGAATLQVRLQQQALHLAAFGLLLALDLVQGELQRRGLAHSGRAVERGGRHGEGGAEASVEPAVWQQPLEIVR
jgi:hypothetical protein